MKHLFTKLIYLFVILNISNAAIAQCSLKGEYHELIDIEVYDSKEMNKKILVQKITTVDKSKCYAKYVNSIPVYFDYLRSNFSNGQLYSEIDLDQDSLAIENAFKEALNKDTELQGKLDEYMLKVSGKLPKDTILFSELHDIAVKFFAINKIDEQGRYVGKVCVGINLLEETLPKRNPFVEAAAFAAIMSDLKFEHSTLMNNFKGYMRELYNLNLGNDQEDRLLRAQGVMMQMMKKDVQLNGILAYFYAQHEKDLPFVIRPNS